MSFGEQFAPFVIQAESSGNPNAVSPVGAQGLMQLMPETGAELAQRAGVTYNPFDPAQNQQLGTMYLDQLYNQFGQDPRLALASYNYGMGNINKAMARAGANTYEAIEPYLPRETREYVPRVMQYAANANAEENSIPWEEVPIDSMVAPAELGQQEMPVIENQFLARSQEPQQEFSPEEAAELFGAVDQTAGSPQEMSPEEAAEMFGGMGAPEESKDYSWGDYVSGIGGDLAQGLMFDFADETPNPFGEGTLVDREFNKQFREDYPITSLSSQFVGGVLPTIASYFGTVGSAGAGAPAAAASTVRTATLGSKLARALMGGGKAAGRVLTGVGGSTAKTGAGRIAGTAGASGAQGFLSGYGSGEGDAASGDRIAKGLLGGTLGTLFGVGGGSVSEYVNLPKYADTGTRRLSKLLNEAGTTDGEIASAGAKMSQAAEEGVPMFVPDAIDQAEVTKLSKSSLNRPGNRTIAANAIDARRANQADRFGEVLDNLAPADSSFNAGKSIQNKSRQALEESTKELSEKTKLTYSPIWKKYKTVPEEAIGNVFDEKKVARIANELRGTREFANAKNNDAKFLHEIKSRLWEESDVLASKGRNRDAKRVSDAANEIRDALHNNIPGLKKADKMFGEGAEAISRLKKTGVGQFAGMDEFSVQKIGKYLMNPKQVPDAQLDELVEALGEEGAPLVRSAIRNELQDLVEFRRDNLDVTAVLKSEGLRRRVSKLLGEEEADKLINGLRREYGFAKMNNDLNFRSDTFENNMDSAGTIKKIIQAFVNPVEPTIKGAGKIVDRTLAPRELRLAEVLLDTQKGAKALDNIGAARTESLRKISDPKRAAILGGLLRGANQITP